MQRKTVSASVEIDGLFDAADSSERGTDNKGFATDSENKDNNTEFERDRETHIRKSATGKMSRDKHIKTSAILSGLQYKVDDNPPLITTFLLGFQHYLTLLSSNLATPGIIAGCICAIGIPDETRIKSELMGNMLFACGLCTLIQAFIGSRLPIVQCPAYAYIVPMIALTKIGRWKCPDYTESTSQDNTTSNNSLPLDGEQPLYVGRMNELVGSLMVASLVEILIGASGMVGILLRFIGPLTVAPTIMLMGLSVAETGFDLAGKHWAISARTALEPVAFLTFLWLLYEYIGGLVAYADSANTIVLIVLLSEIIPTFHFKNPFKRKRSDKIEFIVHKLFSVIISVCIMWLFCYILTVAGAFPEDKSTYGFEARTDIRLDVIDIASWIRFPYPGHWGMPTFSSAIFVAMIAGVITSVIESIGDYYTCARLAGALPPPPHAVNRGILIEGIDCILSTAVGAGFGVTSCSQNIGVISLTKVGSRRVVLMAGAIMMVFGCLGKFSALAVSMPDPIIGASFLVLFGVLAAVGASNLQYVDLNSSRNLVVFGISLFLGLSFPSWLLKHSDLIKTGNDSLDQVINALLANNMFMGCFSALVLDNTIPGTDEERGIVIWRKVADHPDNEKYGSGLNNTDLTLDTYNPPFITEYLRKWKYAKYIPFFPTFTGFDNLKCCCKGQRTDFSDTEVVLNSEKYTRELDHIDSSLPNS